ncbi:distal tail protein Dit [Enterococcus sp. DIV0876]|uniref:distal tail protein Dit n=1 Tax=Enterococcus sp. DIV0876 TaxID=2774633 RepID=UPI003D2FE1CF
MTYGYFEIDNHKSSDFDLYINTEISFSSPEVKGDFVEINGQDGDLYLTDGKLKNVSKSFPAYLMPTEASQQQRATEISNWLKNNVGWKELYFSGDKDYIYQAIYTDEYEVEANIGEHGKTILTFSVKPYKFLKSGFDEQVLSTSIDNPTQRIARPKITIKGTGNITLQIGKSTYNLKDIDGGVIIDVLYDQVKSLDGTRPQWNKITTYPLPGINPGLNNVLITGTVTEIKIIPRWEVIV